MFLHLYEENLVSDSPQVEGMGKGKSTTNTMNVGSEMGGINHLELSLQLMNHRLM